MNVASNFRAGIDVPSSNKPKKKQKRASVITYKSTTLSLIKDSDAVFTSVAQYFNATNTLFKHAMHPEFIKLYNMLRSEYTPPSERRLAKEILDVVH